MEQGLKERLTGAAVVVILAVIFIPMLLDDSEESDLVLSETNIPPKPENMPHPPEMPVPLAESEFTSRVIPLEQATAESDPETVPAIAPESTTAAPADDTSETPVSAEPVTSEQAEVQTAAPESLPTEAQAVTPGTGQQSTTAVMRSEDGANDVGLSAWVVQLGSFSSEANAEALNQKLRKAGFRSFVEPLQQDGQRLFRVRVGPELKRSDAQAIKDKLNKTLQVQGNVVQYP